MTDHACRGSSCGLAGSASQPVEYPYGLCDVSQGELDWLSPDWHEDLSATAVIAHESVTLPPTNHTAERAIRPGVLWRKGSFGTQSAEGSRFVESMMTVVATLKQQQRNVLEFLTAACEAALRGEAAPSLLPASDQEAQTAA